MMDLIGLDSERCLTKHSIIVAILDPSSLHETCKSTNALGRPCMAHLALCIYWEDVQISDRNLVRLKYIHLGMAKESPNRFISIELYIFAQIA